MASDEQRYVSLVHAIQSHEEKDFDNLPIELQRLVDERFPQSWGGLSANERFSLAVQLDDQHDPGKAEVQKYYGGLVDRRNAIQRSINELDVLAARGAGEYIDKEDRLQLKRKELAEVETQLSAPFPSDDAAEPQAALSPPPPPRIEPAPLVADTAPPYPHAAPVATKQTARPLKFGSTQDEAILSAIRERGLDPSKLDKNKPGKSGIKAEIRAALVGVNLVFPREGKQFDKAWDRLRARGDIADKP